MRTYGQYCPVARAAEVLERRWTLIIIRNLMLGCTTFREIEDGAPGIPKALLRDRLGQLEALGLVERRPKPRGRGSQWRLTDAGLALQPVCDALGDWGTEWLDVRPEHRDPYVTLWSICRLLPDEAIGEDRLVVRFEFGDSRLRRVWLIVDAQGAEVCVKPPGFDEDLSVRTDTRTLLEWHLGRLSLGQAMHTRRLEVEGPSRAVRALAAWGGLGRPDSGRAAAGAPTARAARQLATAQRATPGTS